MCVCVHTCTVNMADCFLNCSTFCKYVNKSLDNLGSDFSLCLIQRHQNLIVVTSSVRRKTARARCVCML